MKIVLKPAWSYFMYVDQYVPALNRTALTDMVEQTQTICRLKAPCRYATQTVSENCARQENESEAAHLPYLYAERTRRNSYLNKLLTQNILTSALESPAITAISELLLLRIRIRSWSYRTRSSACLIVC